MEITTDGSFSTLGTTGADVIGNGTNNSASIGILTINGGTFIGSAAAPTTGTQIGTCLGLGWGPNCTLNIQNGGTATLTQISLNNASGTINIDGGTLELNKIVNYGGTNNLYINNGTLKARQNETAFVSGLSGVYVKSGGAIIDTGVYNVAIGNILREDNVTPSLGGGITKNGTGLLTLSQISTTTGAANITAGGLSVVAGSTSWKPASFTHSGNILNFNVGVYNPANLAAIDTTAGTGTVTFNSPITVNVTGSQFVVGQIPLIKYDATTPGKLTGFENLTLNTATLPPGVQADLLDDGNGLIYLDVTSGSFVWSGASAAPGTGDWDTSSSNWNTYTSVYSDGAPVSFPTIAGGGTVTLTEDVSPFSVEFTNTAGNDYVLAGTSKITGTTSVTKSSSGKVSLNNSLNDYSGNTIINAGVVSIASTAALPGWNANSRYPVASGATLAVQNTVADASIVTMLGTNNFAAGSLLGFDIADGDRDFAANLSGATGVAVLGSNVLTLSGTNSNTGPIRVSDGTLQAGSTGAFAGTGSLELSGTGILDLNGYDVSMTIDYNSYRYGNLDLNGFNETINGLSGNGRIDNIAGTTPSVLTLGAKDATATFGGGIRNTAALTTPAATVSLVKIGTGTQTLGSLTTSHSCGVTLDSPTVTIGSTAALAPGIRVTGTGIPADTTIVAIVNATSFTISANATETNTATSLSFTNANSYTGTTSIQGGTLALAASGTIDSSSAVSIAAGAKLQTTAKPSYAIPAGQTFTLQLDAAGDGSSGQILAAGLDISNATVAFDIVNGPLNDDFYILATYSSRDGDQFLSVPTVSGYTPDYSYNGGTQIALVKNASSGYSAWADDNAGNQTADLDYDFDGVENGIEYFMGVDTPGFTAHPGVVTAGAVRTVTWPKRADFAGAYAVQVSTDLSSWLPADPGSVNDTGTAVILTLPGGNRNFVRLQVTPN